MQSQKRKIELIVGKFLLAPLISLWVVNLPWLPVWCHTGLTGDLVSAHLESDDVSPFLLLLLVKGTWVWVRLFWSEGGASVTLLLCLPTESNDRRESLEGSVCV